jgi:hypothetical protein
MKKLLMLLGTTTVLFLACNVNWNDLAIPEQVKVDTQPGLYLSLTRNLFTGEERGKYSPEKLITDNLSPKKVKEMIGDSMPGITVATYTYKDPAGDPDKPIPQTYLLRYPIMEMPLDLSQYMEQFNVNLPNIELNVDNIPGYTPGGSFEDSPLPIPGLEKPVTVELRDMANLVKTMNYTRFGIKIKGNYKGILQVDISNGDDKGFSVSGESEEAYEAGGYTYFVSSYDPAKEWTPKEHGTLTLTIKLLKAPEGGNISIAPEFVLDWTTATVDPGTAGTLEGEMPLDLTSLKTTLEGIEFTKVEAYLYVSGLSGSKATVSLTSGDTELVPSGSLTDAAAPKFVDGDEYAKALPLSSTASSIELTETLNASLSTGQMITYKVEFEEMSLPLEETEAGKEPIISAVLLIKLPLEFKYTGEEFSDTGTTYSDSKTGADITDSDYVVFKMKDFDIATIFKGDDDLLKPIKDELSGNDVTLNFKNLSLILTGCDTTLLPGVSIAIKLHKGADTGRLIDFSSSPGKDIRFDFEMEDDEPFVPVIHILLKKGEDGSAVLALGNGGQFRFGLGVEVESKLDATIEL